MENWVLSDAYREKRQRIEARFEGQDPLPDPVSVLSPSGRFSLSILRYNNPPNAWDYSRGIVARLSGTGQSHVADVKRNYGAFPYAFVAHPNGHEYLICGEDYQGQTVINLETGARVDYAPETMARGCGFCWVEITWRPEDPYRLAVFGCIWGGPYERHVYDITEPEALPYPLREWEYEIDEDEDEDEEE